MKTYFLHIPKTSGTSVISALDAEITPDASFPAQRVPHVPFHRPEMAKFRFARGHLGASLEVIADVRPDLTFTMPKGAR